MWRISERGRGQALDPSMGAYYVANLHLSGLANAGRSSAAPFQTLLCRKRSMHGAGSDLEGPEAGGRPAGRRVASTRWSLASLLVGTNLLRDGSTTLAYLTRTKMCLARVVVCILWADLVASDDLLGLAAKVVDWKKTLSPIRCRRDAHNRRPCRCPGILSPPPVSQ